MVAGQVYFVVTDSLADADGGLGTDILTNIDEILLMTLFKVKRLTNSSKVEPVMTTSRAMTALTGQFLVRVMIFLKVAVIPVPLKLAII